MKTSTVSKLASQINPSLVGRVPQDSPCALGRDLLAERFGETFTERDPVDLNSLLNALDNRLALAQGLVRTTGSLATAWRNGSGVDMQALCSVFALIEEEILTATRLGRAIGEALPDQSVRAPE